MLLSGWIDSSGWVHCPVCGNKTRTKVNRDTVLKRFPLFCPKCGHEHIIDVQENKIVSLEPDAKTQSRIICKTGILQVIGFFRRNG